MSGHTDSDLPQQMQEHAAIAGVTIVQVKRNVQPFMPDDEGCEVYIITHHNLQAVNATQSRARGSHAPLGRGQQWPVHQPQQHRAKKEADTPHDVGEEEQPPVPWVGPLRSQRYLHRL